MLQHCCKNVTRPFGAGPPPHPHPPPRLPVAGGGRKLIEVPEGGANCSGISGPTLPYR